MILFWRPRKFAHKGESSVGKFQVGPLGEQRRQFIYCDKTMYENIVPARVEDNATERRASQCRLTAYNTRVHVNV